MNILDNFSGWMKLNSKLADSSIYKYARAINTISDEMVQLNVIPKDLFTMNLLELDIAIINILNNTIFIKKNTTGNSMYSNSLKQFRYFVLTTVDKFEQEDEIVNTIKQDKVITETEKAIIIKARIGQGPFRKSLMQKYEGKCIVTGIDNAKLLIASHIKPWSICDNKNRIDTENGLLLSANYDRLFDSGLITFNSVGRMFVSSFVGIKNETRLGITKDLTVNLKTTSILLYNLEYHRDVLFVK